MSKLTRKGAAKKCHDMWSLCVRARDGKCVICGRTEGKLDAHHGVACRGNGVGKHWFILKNGFALCFQDHLGVHQNKTRAFMDNWHRVMDSMVSKEEQEAIIRARHETAKYTIEDLEGIYENLAKEYAKIIEEKGIK